VRLKSPVLATKLQFMPTPETVSLLRAQVDPQSPSLNCSGHVPVLSISRALNNVLSYTDAILNP